MFPRDSDSSRERYLARTKNVNARFLVDSPANDPNDKNGNNAPRSLGGRKHRETSTTPPPTLYRFQLLLAGAASPRSLTAAIFPPPAKFYREEATRRQLFHGRESREWHNYTVSLAIKPLEQERPSYVAAQNRLRPTFSPVHRVHVQVSRFHRSSPVT